MAKLTAFRTHIRYTKGKIESGNNWWNRSTVYKIEVEVEVEVKEVITQPKP